MIDYVAIGYVCADLQPDGSTRLGGTALFAALTAHRLGLRTAILTSCAPDFDLSAAPPSLTIVRQSAPVTTMFENRYTDSTRTQFLHAHATPIDVTQMPLRWHNAPIVHLAPIMLEVPTSLPPTFASESTLVGATPQGWLRHVDASHVVTTDPAILLDLPLNGINVVIMSEEDVQFDEHIVTRLAQRLPLVVLTRAERGATVFEAGQPTDVPACPADVVDPTGAGDVFAAAFLMMLRQGQAPVAAARWACAAAACSIEAAGISGLPDLAQLQQRFALC